MSKLRIALVGLDAFGRRVGKALRNTLPDIEVVGHAPDSGALRTAQAEGAIVRGEWNLARACEGAGVVLIAAPRDELRTTLQVLRRDASANVLIVSLGRTLGDALALAQELLPAGWAFISSHLLLPPTSSNTDSLSLERAVWAAAPYPGTPSALVEQFVALAHTLGAHPLFVDPHEHDGMAVALEVLPLALASALVLAVSSDAAWRDRLWMTGETFAQAVQIVEDNARALDAMLASPQVIAHWLNQVMLSLMALRDAVTAGDAEATRAWLHRARTQRDSWLTEWARGRAAEIASETPLPRPSLLSFLVGERLAQRLGDKPPRT
ncbi:MAG: prephenate dehydrogenase/arogenate dehydrogenase family protein [Thermoflexales bacterium]|nr:prephenate dehydrogenase/arogenate dehydrogenase family protein [Thermoflexales bacterium]